MTFEFLPAADEAFREAARYYESEAAGVGLSFIAAVHKAVAEVVEFPLAAQMMRAGIRKKVCVTLHTIFFTPLKLVPSWLSRWLIKENGQTIGVLA